MENRIVILDMDNDYSVMGILTVKDCSTEKVYDIFSNVKKKYEGCWTTEDLFEGLTDNKIEWEWEKSPETMII